MSSATTTGDDTKMCPDCRGEGVREIPGGGIREDADVDGDPTLADLKTTEIECDECGGSGEVHTEGCPRCGSDNIGYSLMPRGGERLVCSDCGRRRMAR